MALTSVFYDGPVTETDRAKNLAGTPEYGVYGVDDFRVTAHPSIPYAVLVRAGKAYGHGVTDTAAVDQVVQCPTLASGTRWDLIVVRRNWQPAAGGPSTLEVLNVGPTPLIPAGRKVGPGVEDDQPVFLVKWQGGTSAPVQFIDLRVWAGAGGAYAKDDLVKTYLSQIGTTVNINGFTWQLQIGANSIPEWVRTSSNFDGVPSNAQQIVKVGNVSVNTTPNGDAYYYFPTPFPNAVVNVVANDATDPAFWPALILKYAAVYSDRTRFCFRVYDAAGNILANKTNLNISFVASGY